MLRARRWHKKSPSGECARAGSGRIKYGRLSSEDAQAGGASVRLPWLLYFTLRCVCRAGRQGAGETGCRGRNRDYRHPLEATPLKTVAGQPMWHCERCGCARSVCTADKRVWLYNVHEQNFLAFHQKILSLSLAALLAARALSRLSRLSRAFRSPCLVTVEFTHTL